MPWVRPYVRSDGTPVSGYSRWAPGARREMTIMAVVALAVMGLGDGTAPASSGRSPRPQSTVHYPIKFATTDTRKGMQRPRPTVSYPIRFPSQGGDR